ncbi:MAG: hypothetical protein JWL86_2795 [Rhizobium sp.]|nr:hypothetical protein [Rhizobium sp.]
MATAALEQIQKAARGRPGVAERTFGARTKFIPTIDRIPVSASESEDDCFDLSKDALSRAKQFRDYCRNRLAEAEGAL